MLQKTLFYKFQEKEIHLLQGNICLVDEGKTFKAHNPN